MHKYISLFTVILGTFFSISAQDNYYYYNGNKVILKKDSTKVVSITPISDNVLLSLDDGYSLLNSVIDNRCNIKLYEIVHSQSESNIDESLLESAQLQPCYSSVNGLELIPNGYINVKLKQLSDYSTLVSFASQYGCELIEQNPFMPLWYNIHLTADGTNNSVDVANALYESNKFESAFPSFTSDALEISYDPNVYDQWNLCNTEYEDLDISISQAWNYATGRGIKIAIVDEGIDLTHQDLIDNIYPLSYDAETKTSPSKRYGDHATHCAGIAAAVRNNGIQVAGVAPDATLMSISVRLVYSTNYETNLANGINWAWSNGADIISCSWRCPENDLVKDAISNAVKKGREGKGCVFVKSAGNSSGPITFPGDYSEDVIAVANMTINGSLYETSSYGENMFITAPGTSILSTLPNNTIGRHTGTSMACPHVAGLAALILEINPNLSTVKVREIIAKSAKKIGTYTYTTQKKYGLWNRRYGYGLIDAHQAVINTPRK